MKKILVVDDDELLRRVLVSDFARRGYEVCEAGDGAQALEWLARKSFDLVISDVKMPKMDGAELLTTIREIYQEVPVFIFVTGFTEMSLEEAYNKGACALFSKPFNRQNFLKAVEWNLLPTLERWKEPIPRLSTDFRIEMTLKNTNQTVQGQMLNIGRGGMFVSMEAPFPAVGETLEFHIFFNHAAAIQLSGQGIIRWVRSQSSSGRSGGCGIEFLNFADNSMPEVIRLIETFKPLSFTPEI